MPRDIYDPIKLNKTNRYPGYQLYTRIRMNGMSELETFHYVILSIYHWVRSKVPEEDRGVEELQVPEAEEYGAVSAESFVPFHLNIGFALDITPLMDSGIWALRIKETDSGTDDRPAVIGRFFTTRVGVRLTEKGYTELGIKIDVTDPASLEKEVDFAFRPGFVRTLASQPSVFFEQARELKYGNAEQVKMDDDYKRMLYMLDNEDNQFPLVVFTYFRPGEKKTASVSIEEFVKSDQMKSFLNFSGIRMPGPGLEFPAASDNNTAAAPILPYDADKFSRSAFAYALTYVLDDKYIEKLRKHVKTEFSPGDVLILGSRRFRGGVTVIGYPGSDDERIKKCYADALRVAQSYSKHKEPYSFGSVVFEAEARKMEQHIRIMEIVNSSTVAEKDKISQLKYEMQMLFEVIDDKDEDIKRLNAQVGEAFDRGLAAAESDMAKLREEIDGLRNELASRQAVIDHMQNSFQQAREIVGVLEQLRSVEELPEDNEAVVRYFRTVYGDRLDFTDRGASTAAKCGYKPASLWSILYTVANRLVDAFRNSSDSLTEADVMKATGFEMSFREGSTTREQREYMRLREDQYNGETISVEPHLKLKSAKGEPDYQRLHFCYDPEMRRIVIGYLGDHLDSAATRHVK